MTYAESFNPDDPFDALADLSRKRVVDVIDMLLETEQYASLDGSPTDQAAAVIIGLMTGVAALALALSDTNRHHEVQTALLDAVPLAINNARDLLGLPPLEALQ